MGSVLAKIVQAPGIGDKLWKLVRLLLKISYEDSKHLTNEDLQYIKSSIVTALGYREMLHSLELCCKMSNIRVHDRLFGIEMTVAMTFSTIQSESWKET